MAYLPLSTANLPDPVIDPAQGSSPEDYFNTVIWTGNGTSQSITGVGHQTDMIWAKCRSLAVSHIVYDVIRGVTKRLLPDRTEAEETQTNHITSFDSDGFSLGNSDSVNKNATTYVGWSWKANGSGVSNTDGSITSTVSANTTSGFSIVTWTGNGTNGASVGHGLNQTPDLYIIKNRDAAETWWVSGYPQMSSVFSTAYQFLQLSSTSALATAGGTATTATSTEIEFTDSGAATNESGSDMVCYAFHSVEGFSKFGSYTGNGSADGPFVYTGFRPAWVLIMCSSASANHPLADNARDTYNPAGTSLFPETTDGDNSKSGREIDFVSNGFKIRNGNAEKNTSGATYIYMAFAENPFKYSNAR